MVHSDIQVARLAGVDIHYRDEGNQQGRPIVFANSLGTDLHLWDSLLRYLPSDYRLIRYDKRGHGLSSCPDGPYSMKQLSEDIEHLLDYLSIRDCLFIGLSIGGMIGQALASRRPDQVSSLVLACTAAKMGEPAQWEARIHSVHTQGMESIADAVMQRWFAPGFLATPASIAWRNMLTRTPSAGYAGCCHAIAHADLSEQTAKLQLPALGIAGSDDGASPPEMVKATLQSIPHSRFQVIDNAGHLPCVEQPAQFADLLLHFMREIHYV